MNGKGESLSTNGNFFLTITFVMEGHLTTQ